MLNLFASDAADPYSESTNNPMQPSTRWVLRANGRLVGEVREQSGRYHIGNHQNSTLMTLSGNGTTVTATLDHDSWGEPLTGSVSLESGSAAELRHNVYSFTGMREANAGQTTHHHARDYRADLRTWIQTDQYMDPWSDLGLSMDPTTRERSLYAGGNPVSFVDQDGHRPAVDCGGRRKCEAGNRKAAVRYWTQTVPKVNAVHHQIHVEMQWKGAGAPCGLMCVEWTGDSMIAGTTAITIADASRLGYGEWSQLYLDDARRLSTMPWLETRRARAGRLKDVRQAMANHARWSALSKFGAVSGWALLATDTTITCAGGTSNDCARSAIKNAASGTVGLAGVRASSPACRAAGSRASRGNPVIGIGVGASCAVIVGAASGYSAGEIADQASAAVTDTLDALAPRYCDGIDSNTGESVTVPCDEIKPMML